MSKIIKVGMADLAVATRPDQLQTSGLGSCVGVALYDPQHYVAGLAHVMLPDFAVGRQNELNRAKYVNTALPLLLQKMEQAGGNRKNIVAKIAGGAQMFALPAAIQAMRIGPNNVRACKLWLHKMAIPILAEDTGGKIGRTVLFCSLKGTLMIKTAHQGVKEV